MAACDELVHSGTAHVIGRDDGPCDLTHDAMRRFGSSECTHCWKLGGASGGRGGVGSEVRLTLVRLRYYP